MGDSPIRAFTVAAVLELATGAHFSAGEETAQLIQHLNGGKLVKVMNLHGAAILKARRALVLQHGSLLNLSVGGRLSEIDHFEAFKSGFLDAAEQLYGYPADVGKSGKEDKNRYVFVRSAASDA